jgi:hypothetical protein
MENDELPRQARDKSEESALEGKGKTAAVFRTVRATQSLAVAQSSICKPRQYTPIEHSAWHNSDARNPQTSITLER